MLDLSHQRLKISSHFAPRYKNPIRSEPLNIEPLSGRLSLFIESSICLYEDMPLMAPPTQVPPYPLYIQAGSCLPLVGS